ncbi:MAG: hypothetical protein A3C04_00230 [Candidatus Wildermuthbacteria bacterium RIFCSPHIGHO2_02_FULL_45_25]|uniref:Uncharacterized protein n=1 Tax=Candidatus Wildermuthbacteria bacterium RIFCSPHIGHO2_02_FULL_45_25 TaxID=1802450 RepID=A0A1G2R1R6_9BACT|nr:MAG: hypothetical protein A3C04_00230 [Candidatus Wildermuthbacteria bacterium RIFCSPHIGHO2_02_FULL_45_25]
MSRVNPLELGRATEIVDPHDRRIYRALEMLHGALSWGTLIFSVVGAWLFPVWTAIFVIAFALYWVFRFFYFLFHLQAGYRKFREYETTD